ncbi:hypothetical protein O3P69_006243 [Scylla paramamosain]|uniref:Ionotropic glutamate receptor L-glutamate and glycine-binding domain-containing protein n=1 Tax=Scylla paramamosain TaxID=85552 RepID=A0AAW0U6W3_SCYPA
MVFTFEDWKQGLPGCKGYAADLIRLIQGKLNFTEIILPVYGFGSVTSNGSWNGMVGELSRLKADMSPLDFSPSADRASVLDFGLTYSLDGVVILGKAPSLVSRPFLVLNIFSPLMWACLLAMTWSAGAALGVLEEVEASLSGGDRHPLSWFTSVFKIFVYQSSRLWPRGIGGRVVSSVVMLAALIVGSLYSGFITAFLAIPRNNRKYQLQKRERRHYASPSQTEEA